MGHTGGVLFEGTVFRGGFWAPDIKTHPCGFGESFQATSRGSVDQNARGRASHGLRQLLDGGMQGLLHPLVHELLHGASMGFQQTGLWPLLFLAQEPVGGQEGRVRLVTGWAFQGDTPARSQRNKFGDLREGCIVLRSWPAADLAKCQISVNTSTNKKKSMSHQTSRTKKYAPVALSATCWARPVFASADQPCHRSEWNLAPTFSQRISFKESPTPSSGAVRQISMRKLAR